MNPYVAANHDALEEMYQNLIELLEKLDDDAVNWSPPVDETNTITAMVTHTVGATNGWLSRAVGTPIQRDRDAEFRGRASVDGLVKLIRDGRAQARDYFARLADADPATIRSVRRLSRGEDQDVSIGWCVEHALLHAGEHWGQIQLTAQWYRAQ